MRFPASLRPWMSSWVPVMGDSPLPVTDRARVHGNPEDAAVLAVRPMIEIPDEALLLDGTDEEVPLGRVHVVLGGESVTDAIISSEESKPHIVAVVGLTLRKRSSGVLWKMPMTAFSKRARYSLASPQLVLGLLLLGDVQGREDDAGRKVAGIDRGRAQEDVDRSAVLAPPDRRDAACARALDLGVLVPYKCARTPGTRGGRSAWNTPCALRLEQ